MDNINNNTVGDNQNNGAGQGVNDMNNSANSTIPTGDDIVSSLTAMPTPPVSTAPVGVQPVQPANAPSEPTPTPMPFDEAALMGTTPAAVDTSSSSSVSLPTSEDATPVIPTQEETSIFQSTTTPTQSTPIPETPAVDQPSEISGTPIVESTPVEQTSPVIEEVTPPVAEETVEPVKESEIKETSSQSLSQPLPSFAPAPSENAFTPVGGEEVVSNLEEGKEEKSGKGGTIVVIVLIVIIVALLATIGYFAYKIFFQ